MRRMSRRRAPEDYDHLNINGYSIDFKSKTVSGKGLSFDFVSSLVKDSLGSGYVVYTDNFYTSPLLLPTPEPARIWSLWNIQAGKSRCPHHPRKCPHQKIPTRQYPVDLGQRSFVCKVDGHQRGLPVLHHPPRVQWRHSATLAEDSLAVPACRRGL